MHFNTHFLLRAVCRQSNFFDVDFFEGEISDLFFFANILNFLIGAVNEVWQFILTKNDLNIFMSFFPIKISSRLHLDPLLDRQFLVIIIVKTIEDEWTLLLCFILSAMQWSWRRILSHIRFMLWFVRVVISKFSCTGAGLSYYLLMDISILAYHIHHYLDRVST